MRQACSGLGDIVNVKENRAGNMPGIIILTRGRGDARLLERRVDNTNMRIDEMRGEPVGGDQRFGMGIWHCYSRFVGSTEITLQSPPTPRRAEGE